MYRWLRLLLVVCLALGAVFGGTDLGFAVAAKTTIRVLSFKDGHALAVFGMLSEFQKSTGIEVKMDLIPSSAVASKIVTDQAGGASYDVYLIDEPYLPQLASFLLPLNKWPGQSSGKKVSDFVAPAMAAGAFAGQEYGLPVNGNVYLYVYRKDLFSDAKEQADFQLRFKTALQPPQDLESFVRVARFFYRPPHLYGFAPFTRSSEGTTVEMLWILGLMGVNLFDSDGALQAKPQAIATALASYRQLMAFSPPGSRMWHHAERMRAYAKGRVAQMMTWPSFLRDLENPDKSLVVGRSGYGNTVASAKGHESRAVTALEHSVVAGSWVIALSRTSKNHEAAAQFARWWAHLPNADELLRRGLNPARRDVLVDPSFARLYPWFEATLRGFEHAQIRPRTARYREVSRLLSSAFTEAVTEPGQLQQCRSCAEIAERLASDLRREWSLQAGGGAR